MERSCSLLAGLVLLVATAAPAIAQDDSAKYDRGARSHFEIGEKLYEQGRFEEAAKEFEEAHRLSGRPEMLYNIYLAYRDTGQLEKALESLRAYLASDAKIDNRERLEAALQVLERKVGKPAEKPSEGAGNEPHEMPAGAPSKEPEGEEQPSSHFPVVPVILVSAGGAAVLAGVVTGALALGADSDLDRMCPGRVCPPDLPRTEAKDTSDKISTLSSITDVLLVGGIVVAGVGVVLLTMDGSETESDLSAPVATAGCGPTGCAARLNVSF